MSSSGMVSCLLIKRLDERYSDLLGCDSDGPLKMVVQSFKASGINNPVTQQYSNTVSSVSTL
jgi:hypothetical protein